MAKIDVFWTDAEDAVLRELVPTGLSYRAIGERLGRGKNATISRAKRLGICKLAPTKAPWNKGTSLQICKPDKSVKPNPRKKPAPYFSQTSNTFQCVTVEPSPDAQNLPFSEMGYGKCWYPEGENPAEMTFCGAATPIGSSWCAYHRKIVYVPYQPAKKPSTRAYR